MPRPGSGGVPEKSKNFGGTLKKLFLSLEKWKVLVIFALVLAIASAILALITPNKLRLEEKGVTLTVDVDDEVVVGDYDMMQSVFNNFFGNAINHVEGECKIKVTGKKTENNKFRVSVFNTGLQISEDNQQRIWDSFYKIDKSRSRQYGGSGLGLSIVKSIMTTYNNDFGVYNNDDGVTFFFELDLLDEERGNDND